MNWLRLARARLTGFFRKEELEHEIDEELRFHVAMRTQENIARGMSPAEAAREARLQFGNVDHIKDEWRDVSGGGGLETFAQDVRFAARMLLKDRAFTIVAVLALALGIGANTALFTVLSDVLLRPLPYSEPHEIMAISMRDNTNEGDSFPVSYPDFLDFRARTRAFERLGAFRSGTFVVRSDGGEAAGTPGAWMTSDVLPVLGVKPAIGRAFLREEENPGNRTVLISHGMWEDRFGRAANVTKASLAIDGVDHAIIGVMPPGFRFPIENEPAQFWITFAAELEPLAGGQPAFPSRRDSHFLRLVGRLKDGLTREEGHQDLRAIAADLATKYPESNRNYDDCIVLPLLEELTMRVRPVLLLLIGAAFCTLCVACANVANLLLARASTRQKEIAVRAALGAGRRRIFRQLLTESLLLAAIGGLVGLVLALVATRYIVSALPRDFPRVTEIAPDMRVLAFTLGLTALTSCLFGIAPCWRSARAKLSPLLNDAGPRSSDTPGGRRARSVLVVTEMVLAFALLAAACFFISQLARMQSAPLGFDPRGVVAVNLFAPDDKRPNLPARISTFFQELVRRVSLLDGVQSASAGSRLPLTSTVSVADFEIAGRPMHRADLPLAEPHMVLPGYFRTLGIPLKSGRDFDARDRRGAARVVIVNETLARRFFPGENPLGKRITPGLFVDAAGPVESEIIGVVGDVRANIETAEPMPQFYVPLAQTLWFELALVVRVDRNPAHLMREIDAIVAAIDPNVAIGALATMEERLAGAVATPRLNSTLLAAFSAVAVVLTAIGVYGVMAYSTAQRRHEIGIRLALGAPPLSVFRLVLGEGLRLIGYAILIGTVVAVIMMPTLQAFTEADARYHLAAVCLAMLLLGLVAVVACWLPARRASTLDPLVALGQR